MNQFNFVLKLLSIAVCVAITSCQLETTKLKAFKSNCAFEPMYTKVHTLKLKFQIEPYSNSTAQYNPKTNTVIIKDMDLLNQDYQQEELFHAYQNSTYSGGVDQYMGKTGHSNIEFESHLYRTLISTVQVGTYCGALVFAGKDWDDIRDWIMEITNWGEVLPKTFNQLNTPKMSYYQAIELFKRIFPQYKYPTDTSMQPKAMLNLFNSIKSSYLKFAN